MNKICFKPAQVVHGGKGTKRGSRGQRSTSHDAQVIYGDTAEAPLLINLKLSLQHFQKTYINAWRIYRLSELHGWMNTSECLQSTIARQFNAQFPRKPASVGWQLPTWFSCSLRALTSDNTRMHCWYYQLINVHGSSLTDSCKESVFNFPAVAAAIRRPTSRRKSAASTQRAPVVGMATGTNKYVADSWADCTSRLTSPQPP